MGTEKLLQTTYSHCNYGVSIKKGVNCIHQSIPVIMSAGFGQQIDALRKGNEQLRREKAIDRQKVSESVNDIIHFCEQEMKTDPLIFKVSQSENPFIPKKSPCTVL